MNKIILEFKEATEEEQKTAAAAAEVVGDSYFSYNFPLQIFAPDEADPEGNVLNYMPRKERCENLTFQELGFPEGCKREDMKDFCNTTIAILKNMIRQWERFRDGKIDHIHYLNFPSNV